MPELKEYRIVTNKNSSEGWEKQCALELNSIVKKISGFDLELANQADKASFILEEDESMTLDSYKVERQGDCIHLKGGGSRGVFNAMYAMLHEWGYRLFAPDAESLPDKSSLRLDIGDLEGTPAFEYRNFILHEVEQNPRWSAANAFNGHNSGLNPEWGHRLSHWMYGHSFDTLLPAPEHIKEHPEWFDSTSRGKVKIDDHVNLCYTNHEVLKIVTDKILKVIEEDLEKESTTPGYRSKEVYYFAQADGGTPCLCPSCKKLMDDQESYAAPLIHFCNQAAEMVHQKYPSKRLMTIAYRFSRKPPKTLKAHPQLIVQFCSIECCQTHPFRTCSHEENQRFRDDMLGWSNVADRIWIWDYLPRLWHPFLTTPSLQTMGENMRWFKENGVSGYFLQTAGRIQFHWLNAWKMAKLMWNPFQNEKELEEEFLNAYYGAGAAPIKEYIDLVGEIFGADNEFHWTYKAGSHQKALDESYFKKSSALLEQARDAVKGDEQLSARVEQDIMHHYCTELNDHAHRVIHSKCRREDNHYIFDISGEKEKIEKFGKWHKENPDLLAKQFCVSHFESEVVSLDNGKISLDFLPKGDARLIAINCQGNNLIHCPKPVNDGLPKDAGYHETWLKVPDAQQECVSGWNFGTGSIWAAEGGTTASLVEEDKVMMFETGGMFKHPMQWERWNRLKMDEASFNIESQIVNRGNTEEPSQVTTCLPLYLGEFSDITCTVNGESKSLEGLQEFPGVSKIIFSNQKMGLDLVYISEGEVLERLSLDTDQEKQLIRICLLSDNRTLIPGAGVRFLQSIEIT